VCALLAAVAAQEVAMKKVTDLLFAKVRAEWLHLPTWVVRRQHCPIHAAVPMAARRYSRTRN
jgi:hypothetical protein